MANERNNPDRINEANASGVLSVEHGGTGVTTLNAVRDLVNTYIGDTGTDEKASVISEYAKAQDHTTRTVRINIGGSEEYFQIFRTSAIYGNVVIYSGYGNKVDMMSLHNGAWTGPTPIYPIQIPTSLPANGGTATNVSGTVAISHGGTGATTAAGACTNLGASNLLTEIKKVDGSGSGLDADTLDGEQGYGYLKVAHNSTPELTGTQPMAIYLGHLPDGTNYIQFSVDGVDKGYIRFDVSRGVPT